MRSLLRSGRSSGLAYSPSVLRSDGPDTTTTPCQDTPIDASTVTTEAEVVVGPDHARLFPVPTPSYFPCSVSVQFVLHLRPMSDSPSPTFRPSAHPVST